MVVAAVVAEPAVAAGADVAASLAVRALTNIALTIAGTAIAEQIPDSKRKENKDNLQKAKEIGVSTVVTTAASAVLGPEVSFVKAIAVSLLAGQVSQKIAGGTPASDALDQLINTVALASDKYAETHPNLSSTTYPKTSGLYKKYQTQVYNEVQTYYAKYQPNGAMPNIIQPVVSAVKSTITTQVAAEAIESLGIGVL